MNNATPPPGAVCCELWPACDCDVEALDPDIEDNELADPDEVLSINGRLVTRDEYFKYHFDPEARK